HANSLARCKSAIIAGAYELVMMRIRRVTVYDTVLMARTDDALAPIASPIECNIMLSCRSQQKVCIAACSAAALVRSNFFCDSRSPLMWAARAELSPEG